MASEDTVEYRLSQLFRLKERGFISDAEFEAGRLRLVERLLQGEIEIAPDPVLPLQEPTRPIEPVAPPVTDQPLPAAPAWWRRAAMVSAVATGGLFLVLAGALVAQAINGGSDEPGNAERIEADVRVALEEGASGVISPSTAPDQRTQVTTMRVIDPAEPREPEDNPEPGNRYWVVEVFIEAAGTESSFAPTWTLATADGNEYPRLLNAAMGSDVVPAGSLPPGGQSIGLVVFEVPLGAQPEWLRADPDPFGAKDLYFDIAAGE